MGPRCQTEPNQSLRLCRDMCRRTPQRPYHGLQFADPSLHGLGMLPDRISDFRSLLIGLSVARGLDFTEMRAKRCIDAGLQFVDPPLNRLGLPQRGVADF